ncbi:circadian clock protein [Crocosphaera subtropica ATCC 51142]|uniref:Circadian clock oscillator protein KaiA n=1 Tax=Crocosphaera subtropica (strain ATCC 51142 / BH68) TaxID=43989 RepID=B1WND3_CROS5|nr:circadian clock protein KaiA [Crocosphaera subtropica]ACB49775.1 circadian clock protein [Crocosphaera subtropica ATCC 51142]
MQTRLSICLYSSDEHLTQLLTHHLSGDRYRLHIIDQLEDLVPFLEDHSETIDCLIVKQEPSILPLFNQLYEQGTLVPVIIFEDKVESSDNVEPPTFLYHSAEVRYRVKELDEIQVTIDRAITKFLHLGPSCFLTDQSLSSQRDIGTEKNQSFLLLQQRRLAEKLKERLGYLGVYYKRNPKYFYRNLSPEDKRELLKELMANYREIILNYFDEDSEVNQAIDQFVNQAFFADISVSRVLEIHMELMDEFSQQLKLEGRSEEILLDYRLTIIDILAHLGEMYRRCIPRGDLLFDLLNQID